MKRGVYLFTLIFVVLSALIAILGLFEILGLEGFVANLLFTCLTLSAVGLLAINSLSTYEKKNKLTLVSLSLIIISAILVIISLWSTISSSYLYTEITISCCILSVCFNLITSNVLKFQNKYLKLQIPIYICFIIVALFLISATWGINLLENNTKLFVLFIILSLLGMGILSVFSKKKINDNTINYIKITKKEYDELLLFKSEYFKLKGEKND